MGFFCFDNTIRNAPVIDYANEDLSTLWDALTKRAYAAVEDLNALELV